MVDVDQPVPPPAESARTDRRSSPALRRTQTALLQVIERFGLVIFMAAMVTFFALNGSSGAIFISSQNVTGILGDQAIVGVIALATLIPLTAGYFDLSPAATAGLANVVVAALMSKAGWSPLTAMAAGVLVGGAVGVFVGYLVARLRLNPFIVTFGAYVALEGATQWYTQGSIISERIPASVGAWGSADWLGVPRPFWLLLVVAVVLWFVISQTPFGRYLESIGSNESAARLVGIRTERTVWLAMIASGFIAGVAGCLLTTRTGGADASVGPSYLFPALAALFLGATTIRPGRYNVWGTVVGVYFIAAAVSGLILAGVNSSVQEVVNGVVLMIAVTVSTFSGRWRERREERDQRRWAESAVDAPDKP